MKFRRRHSGILAGVLALALITLLFTPVRVSGSSMEPALLDGDLLVTEPVWLRAPRRYDLVVCEEPDTGSRVVKRVAGLPGEGVQIIDGDLFVNGQRQARAVRGAGDLLPLVNARGTALDTWFDFSGAGFRPAAPGWELAGEGEAGLRDPPRNGYLRRGELIPGHEPAVDIGLEVEYALRGESARLELAIQEGGTRFYLVLDKLGRRVRLERRDNGAPAQVLSAVERARAAPHGLVFLANVDQRLTATLDGEPLFAPVPYRAPDPIRLDGMPPELHYEQAAVGGYGPLLILRARVGRDLFFDPAGTHAGSEMLQLAEDQYYVLGDNPPHSRDSRQYGGVSKRSLRGCVLGRLWPPGSVGFGW
ncbi:MAG: signal peptidase I [Planctomycetota bacterium]|nr:MAG: signal peptidase I [Planctomycetota bacterium]